MLLLPEKTEVLVGSHRVLRSIGKQLRDNGHVYTHERVAFKNFNRSWNGKVGICIRVSYKGYQSLFV